MRNQLGEDGDANKTLNELVSFTMRWPNVSTDDFLHIVESSQRMEAKHAEAWPFLIEYHSDKGCWHYARKGGQGGEAKTWKREEIEELNRWPSLAKH